MAVVPAEMGAGEWGRARVVVERWRRVLAVPRPSLYRVERERRGAGRELRGMPPMAAAIGAPEVCGWCCDCCEGRTGDAEGREGAWSSRWASLVLLLLAGFGRAAAAARRGRGHVGREREREEERRKKKMTCGAHVSVTGVMKYTSSYTLQLGPDCVHTYSVAFLWETKNCNGMLQNRRIVMTFLQTSKIIMA